jgi:hypothetical protein
METQNDVLFLKSPEKIPKEKPGQPEDVRPHLDPGDLTNCIPRFMIDIYCLETVRV